MASVKTLEQLVQKEGGCLNFRILELLKKKNKWNIVMLF